MSIHPTIVSRQTQHAGPAFLLLAMAACAQLPTTASVTIPPIPPGEARVWFYRPMDFNEGLNTPYIRMNDAIVAISQPAGASYRDVPAGQYHIAVDSYLNSPQQDQNVALVPAQEIFIKVVSLREWVTGGGGGSGDAGGGGSSYNKDTFYVWQIPPEVARAEVARSAFYGS